MADHFSTTIRATTEVALEKAMFLLGKSKRGRENDEIEWLDMELPVAPGNSSRLDLIGRLKQKGTFVICELKFGNSFNTSDDPVYAANEVVKYFELIRQNYTFVKDQHHYTKNDDGIIGKEFDWKKVTETTTELIVVANAAYWAYWIGHRGFTVPKTGKYNTKWYNVKCYSIDIPMDYFKKQFDGVSEYKPCIDNMILEVL